MGPVEYVGRETFALLVFALAYAWIPYSLPTVFLPVTVLVFIVFPVLLRLPTAVIRFVSFRSSMYVSFCNALCTFFLALG